MTTWVLVLFVAIQPVAIPGFKTHEACERAGEKWVADKTSILSAGRSWYCVEVR